MADPTPMDVDDEAGPTDLVLPDVMEGMLRMAALTTPDTLPDAAKILDTRTSFCIFDGRRCHAVVPFQGALTLPS